ncbi:hypothetical protein ACA910_022024 [Epithemia clementina (nom. ined.)]
MSTHRRSTTVSSPQAASPSATASSSSVGSRTNRNCGTAITSESTQSASSSRYKSLNGAARNTSYSPSRVLTSPSSSLSSSASIASAASLAVIRRLSDDDVRSIFECLHGHGPLPPPSKNLNFSIVPVGSDGQKLSPPQFEFQEGLYVLLRPDKRPKKQQDSRTPPPQPPRHLRHLLLSPEQLPKASCPWSLSGPQFPQPTALQQRYCYPKGTPEYSCRVGGALWTVYGADGQEDLEFRLLHVYFSAKRAVTKGGGVTSSPLATRIKEKSTPVPAAAAATHTAVDSENHSPMQRTPGRSRRSEWEVPNWPALAHHQLPHPWYGASSPAEAAAHYPRQSPWADGNYTPYNRYPYYYGGTNQVLHHHGTMLPPPAPATPPVVQSPKSAAHDHPHDQKDYDEDEDEGFPFRRFHPVGEYNLAASDDSFSFQSTATTPISSPSYRKRREQSANFTPIRSPPALQSKRPDGKRKQDEDAVSPLASPPRLHKKLTPGDDDEGCSLIPIKSFDLDAASFSDIMMSSSYDGDSWNGSLMPLLLSRTTSPAVEMDRKCRTRDLKILDPEAPHETSPMTARLEQLQDQIHDLIRSAPTFEQEALVSSVTAFADDLANDPQVLLRRSSSSLNDQPDSHHALADRGGRDDSLSEEGEEAAPIPPDARGKETFCDLVKEEEGKHQIEEV